MSKADALKTIEQISTVLSNATASGAILNNIEGLFDGDVSVTDVSAVLLSILNIDLTAVNIGLVVGYAKILEYIIAIMSLLVVVVI